MPRILSFCESVHAGPSSAWHLRWLTEAGPKFGGGIDTPSLCGSARSPYGWDLEVAITSLHIQMACKHCLNKLAER